MGLYIIAFRYKKCIICNVKELEVNENAVLWVISLHFVPPPSRPI